MIPNACFKTDRPIQCHTPHPSTLRWVRLGVVVTEMMMMSIQEDKKSSVQIGVFPESPACIRKQDRQVLSLCLRHPASGVQALTWQSVAYCLSCPPRSGSGTRQHREVDRGWGGGVGNSWFALILQHEVSGSATPSASWDTVGHSHTRTGM